jgi:hypothetical protein
MLPLPLLSAKRHAAYAAASCCYATRSTLLRYYVLHTCWLLLLPAVSEEVLPAQDSAVIIITLPYKAQRCIIH